MENSESGADHRLPGPSAQDSLIISAHCRRRGDPAGGPWERQSQAVFVPRDPCVGEPRERRAMARLVGDASFPRNARRLTIEALVNLPVVKTTGLTKETYY